MDSPIQSSSTKEAHSSHESIEAARIAQLDAKEWTPRKGTPLAVSLCLGLCAALAPALLTALPEPYGVLSAAVCSGLAIGLTAHYGIKSSGTQHRDP